jgi:hypothetical protein
MRSLIAALRAWLAADPRLDADPATEQALEAARRAALLHP